MAKDILEGAGIEIPVELSDQELDKTLIAISQDLKVSDDIAKSITGSFKAQSEELKKIRVLSDPKLIGEQVAYEKELQKATEAREKALERARKAAGLGGSKKDEEGRFRQTVATSLSALIGGQSGAGVLGQIGGMVGGAALGPIGAALGGAAGQGLMGAAPAQMEKLNMLLEDITSTIGQAFIPVLDMVTDGIRLFGDILATILPNTEEMGQALAPLKELFSELGTEIRSIMSIIGPFIREVLTESIRLLAKGFQTLLQPVLYLAVILEELAKATGLASKGMRQAAGATVRGGGFQDFNAYQQAFQVAALRAGTISPEQAQIKSENHLQKIREAVEPIVKYVEFLARHFGALTNAAREGVEIVTHNMNTSDKNLPWYMTIDPVTGKPVVSPLTSAARGLAGLFS